jgi:hypothetical protein
MEQAQTAACDTLQTLCTSAMLTWRRTNGRDRYDSTCWAGNADIGRIRLVSVGAKTFWHWTMTIERTELVATSNGIARTREEACRSVVQAYEEAMV